MSKRIFRLGVAVLLCVMICTCMALAACKDDPQQFGVTVHCDGGATAQLVDAPEGNKYEAGATAKLRVSLNSGYTLASVTANGVQLQEQNGVFSFVVSAETTVQVTTSLITYSVTVNCDEGATAQLLDAPVGNRYAAGALATMSVSVDSGYILVSVTANNVQLLPQDDVYKFYVNSDVTVQVTTLAESDDPQQFGVTVHCDGGATAQLVDAPEDNKYEAGATAKLRVSLNSGYTLASVTANGVQLQEQNGVFSFVVSAETTVQVTTAQTVMYSVTFDCDPGVTASVADPSADGTYPAGQTIAVRVEADPGVTLGTVTANGVQLQEQNGVYSFTLEGNTVVRVTVQERAFTAEQLNSLRGSLHFVSEVFRNGEATGEQLHVLFDQTNKAVWQYSLLWGVPNFSVVYRNVDGATATVSHDALGKLRQTVTDVPFDEVYGNPFEGLAATDFVHEVNDTYSLKDADLAKQVATAITGFVVEVDSFTVTGSGDITSIAVQSKDIPADTEGEEPYNYSFDITIEERGTAALEADWFADYEATAEHQPLIEAFQAARTATSFTQQSRSNQHGQQPVSYKTYLDGGLMWVETEPAFGYVTRSDGSVWEMYYPEGSSELTLGLGEVADDLDRIAPTFDFDEIGWGLFEAKGNGVFVMRPMDAVVMNISGLATSRVARSLGTGQSEKMTLEYYTTAMTVVVENNALSRIELQVTDGQQMSASITFTYSDWNNTVLPITVPDDLINGMVDPSFLGDWMDDEGNWLVSVHSSYITVNGADSYTLVENGNGYRAEVHLHMYDVLPEDGKLVLVTEDNVRHTLVRRRCDWQWYLGTFTGTDSQGVQYTLQINADGLTLSYGQTSFSANAKQVNYDDDYNYEGYRAMAVYTSGGNLFIRQYDDGYDRLQVNDYANTFGVVVRRSDVEVDWSDFVGNFSGTDEQGYNYNVVVTEQGVEATLFGRKAQCTLVDRFTLGGQDVMTFYHFGTLYELQKQVDYDRMFFFPSDMSYMVLLTDEDFRPDWSAFYGSYSGADETGRVVSVQVGSEISVSIDGHAATATGLRFDDTLVYSRFYFELDGAAYEMVQYNYGLYTKLQLLQMEGANRLNAVLYRDGYQTDLSKYAGEYRGAAGEHTYSAVITATGLTVTIDGVSTVAADVDLDTFYSETYGAVDSIGFRLNSEVWYLDVASQSVLLLHDYADTTSAYVAVVADWSAFYGTYTGTDAFGYEYTLTISADGIQLREQSRVGSTQYNSTVVAFAYYEEENMYMFFWVDNNGSMYYIEQWSLDGQMLWFYHVSGTYPNVYLTKTEG